MKRILKALIVVLAMFAAAQVFAATATAAPFAPAAQQAGAAQQAIEAQSAAVPASVAAGTANPTPSDTALTSPANAGTGETAEAEGTRMNYVPWIIGAVALIALVAVLIWRWRRRTTNT